MATCHFLPWGSSLDPWLGRLLRVSALYWHDWSVSLRRHLLFQCLILPISRFFLFYIGINQCKSNAVFKTCHESLHSGPCSIYGLECICNSVHLDPIAPVQAADEKNPRYLITVALVPTLQAYCRYRAQVTRKLRHLHTRAS